MSFARLVLGAVDRRKFKRELLAWLIETFDEAADNWDDRRPLRKWALRIGRDDIHAFIHEFVDVAMERVFGGDDDA